MNAVVVFQRQVLAVQDEDPRLRVEEIDPLGCRIALVGHDGIVERLHQSDNLVDRYRHPALPRR
jgi:hypothetical protein